MRNSKGSLLAAAAMMAAIASAPGGPLDYHLDDAPGSHKAKAARGKSSHKQNARKNRKARK